MELTAEETALMLSALAISQSFLPSKEAEIKVLVDKVIKSSLDSAIAKVIDIELNKA